MTLPAACLAGHVAVVAKTAAGKTYLVKSLIVEPALAAGDRVCILDPTAAYWGLRSSADGKGPGFPVVIFGGDHGDVSLGSNHGAALAEIVGGSATPAVLDTRQMTVGERSRFFTDFAETLLRKNKGPLTLVIDEAHLFMPQGGAKGGGMTPAMLHAGNNLVSLGRSAGLRVVMVSQRPAKLHKDSLTQAETLIVLRMIAPQDRRAVEDWIGEWAGPKEGREILASLPSLPTGTAWLWAPAAGVLDKIKVPKLKTFDSSRAGAGDDPDLILAPIDLPTIQSRLAATAAKVFQEDPKRLRAMVAELEKQLSEKTGRFDEVAVKAAAADGFARGLQAGVDAFDAAMKGIADQLTAGVKAGVALALAKRRAIFEDARDAQVARTRLAEIKRHPERLVPVVPRYDQSLPGARREVGAALRILRVLAQRHPTRLTVSQWATLASMKKTGGTWGTYVSRLRSAGYLDQRDGLYSVTDSGLGAAGVADGTPATTSAEVQAMWLAALGGGAGRMLKVLIDIYPVGMDRANLADRLHMTAAGGTFGTYLSRLRSNGLVVVASRKVTASETLFMDGG